MKGPGHSRNGTLIAGIANSWRAIGKSREPDARTKVKEQGAMDAIPNQGFGLSDTRAEGCGAPEENKSRESDAVDLSGIRGPLVKTCGQHHKQRARNASCEK